MKQHLLKICELYHGLKSMEEQLLVETDSTKKEWLTSQISITNDLLEAELENNALVKIEKFVEDKIDPDFDFEVEHWDNGNFDDSYEYGTEVGEEYAFREMKVFLNNLVK
jgi:hypothetical protein